MNRNWSIPRLVMIASAASCLAVVISSLRLLHNTSPQTIAQHRQQLRTQHQPPLRKKAVLDRHLNNRPTTTTAAATQTQAPIAGHSAETSFPALQLLGTFIDPDPTRSTAIIQEPSDAAIRSYVINQEIQGWRLTQIGRAYILLSSAGRTHRIDLAGQSVASKPEAGSGALATAASVLTTGTIPAKQWLAPEETAAVKDAIQELSPVEHVVNRAKMLEALKRQSALRVLREAAVQPVVVQGKLTGARLQSIPQDGVLQYSGFQEGDVVQNINGKPVTDPRIIFELPNTLTQQDVITVSVERGGEPVTLTFNLQ